MRDASWGEVWEEVIWPFLSITWIVYIMLWIVFEAYATLM